MSIFDISSRVIDHIQRAREHARKNAGYVIQLPRDVSRPWPPELIAYWSALGDQVGAAVDADPAAADFSRRGRARDESGAHPAGGGARLRTGGSQYRSRTARPACARIGSTSWWAPTSLSITTLSNRALALENAGAMLKPGGLLLTNDRLPEVPGGVMRQAGVTEVRDAGYGLMDAVGWYQKR